MCTPSELSLRQPKFAPPFIKLTQYAIDRLNPRPGPLVLSAEGGILETPLEIPLESGSGPCHAAYCNS